MIKVIVDDEDEGIVYEFPNANNRCMAHNQALCIRCARNPGTCIAGSEYLGCKAYVATGMHWSTCPNRIL